VVAGGAWRHLLGLVQETIRADGYRYAMLAWSLANRGG
jgi:hypothetical protein